MPIPPIPDGYTEEEWRDYHSDPCRWCIRELFSLNDEVRTNAADILRGLGGDGLPAIPALAACFSDPNDMFRGYCIHAVSDIAWAAHSKTGITHASLINAIPSIVRLLDDQSEYVVCCAINAIEAIGPDAQSAASRLRQLAETGSTDVRRFAEAAVAAITK